MNLSRVCFSRNLIIGLLVILLNSLITLNIGRAQIRKVCGNEIHPFGFATLQKARTEAQEAKFESWLSKVITSKRSRLSINQQEEEIYKVPVVVHIIHPGIPVSDDSTNISKERILQQIAILNEDFRRQNPDAISTPEEFFSVAADTKIEFVLARIDPWGNLTDGIQRIVGKANYNIGGNTFSEVRELNIWPTEHYLNIWVVYDGSSLGNLGIARFPVSNDPEIPQHSSLDVGKWDTDGVVVNTAFFGKGGFAKDFSTGRTLTHEVGHFLGIRHTWGDTGGSCRDDDYCDDTPLSSNTYNSECPSEPQFSCGTSDMYSNYMTYAADRCMNVFTRCQKERMRAILENSPRRKTLLNNFATQDLGVLDNDLAITAIVIPGPSSCENRFFPQIRVVNLGKNTVKNFEVSLTIDGQTSINQPNQTYSSLAPLNSAIITFPEFNPDFQADYKLKFEITKINDASSDDEISNNRKSILYSSGYSLDYNLDNQASGWIFQHDDWQVADVMGDSALKLSYYNSDSTDFGFQDFLISPPVNLSDQRSMSMRFRYAYYKSTSVDPIQKIDVYLVDNCNLYFDSDNLIQTINSSTASSISGEFIPRSESDWLWSEDIILDAHRNSENFRVAFVGTNGLGNNFYIDDFTIFSTSRLDHDIRLRQIVGLSQFSCFNNNSPQLSIQNVGSDSVESVNIKYRIDENITLDTILTELGLAPGKIKRVNLPYSIKEDGTHSFKVDLSIVGEVPDQDLSDNNFTRNIVIDNTDIQLFPVLEDFTNTNNDSDGHVTWTSYSEDSIPEWEYVTTRGGNQAISIQMFNKPVTTKTSWLVSPLMKKEGEDLGLSFKYAFRHLDSISKSKLQVHVAEGCSGEFSTPFLTMTGYALDSNSQISRAYSPFVDEDWHFVYIPLPFATDENEIRVAISFTNQGGNNFYIDDINMYAGQRRPPLDLREEELLIYPNPMSFIDGPEIHLNFRLNTRQNIHYRIITVSGQQRNVGSFDQTLNQTHSIDLTNLDNGTYLIQILGSSIDIVRRFVVNRQ